MIAIVPAKMTVVDANGTETVDPITVYAVETAANLAALLDGHTTPEAPA